MNNELKKQLLCPTKRRYLLIAVKYYQALRFVFQNILPIIGYIGNWNCMLDIIMKVLVYLFIA